MYEDHQSEIIAFYIKDIALMSYCIYRIERVLDVSKTVPICPFGLLIPFFQCRLRLRDLRIILYQKYF